MAKKIIAIQNGCLLKASYLGAICLIACSTLFNPNRTLAETRKNTTLIASDVNNGTYKQAPNFETWLKRHPRWAARHQDKVAKLRSNPSRAKHFIQAWHMRQKNKQH